MAAASIATQLAPVLTAILGEDPPMRIEFWDGSALGSPDAKAQAIFRSPEGLRHVIWSPNELGIARAYVTGDVDIEGDLYYGLGSILHIEPHLQKLGLKTIAKTIRAAKNLGIFGPRPEIPAEETVPPGRVHSKRRDAAAISHHYDVSNEFYRMVLGPTMTYSCARFINADDSLEAAQEQKYDLICRKLGLKEGMRLLDVGCGWGGMVMHAVKNYGVTAVGITLSEEQATLARKRIADAGLQDRIEIRIQDYRDLSNETFDAISSIGMFEHVGQEQMAAYFGKLHSVLADGGRLLNHAISKPNGSVMAANGFIARYVFPDGELQDVSVSSAAMQQAGFEIRDIESLREHYEKTLRFWVRNLEKHWDEAVGIVGSNRARVWRIYMIGSAIAFQTNRISIHQTLGVKTPASGASDMPLTRQSYV